MFFQTEIVIPPNTAQDDPLVTRLQVQPGVTRQVWVMFPHGCFGLVHLQVWYWGWQLWPWTPGSSFAWDDYVFVFEDRYPLTEPPYELVLKAWNDDDTYEHRVTFACTIEPAAPQDELERLHDALLALGLLRG